MMNARYVCMYQYSDTPESQIAFFKCVWDYDLWIGYVIGRQVLWARLMDRTTGLLQRENGEMITT